MQRQQNQLQLINDLKSKCQIGNYKGNHHHQVLVQMEYQMEKEDKAI